MAETSYSCFYNGKLLPQTPALPENGDCCLCCYYKQTIKPPTYIPTPEAPWENNPNVNYEPNLLGCYCTCCPCWPDGSLDFEMKTGKLSFDGGVTFPVDAENLGDWDHTLVHGNDEGAGSNCFMTQLNAFNMGHVGGHWRCGSSNADLYELGGGEYEDQCVMDAQGRPRPADPPRRKVDVRGQAGPMIKPEDVVDPPNFLTTCKKYLNENLYPEAWGYRGAICADGVKYESNRPALITDTPGPDTEDCGGMAIISTLCCCKTGGGSVEDLALPDCYGRCPLPAGFDSYCPGHGIPGGGTWAQILPTWDGEDDWKNNYPPDNNYTCESHCFTYCLMPDNKYKQYFSAGAYGAWVDEDSQGNPIVPRHEWRQGPIPFSFTPASPCTLKAIARHPVKGYQRPENPHVYPSFDFPGTNKDAGFNHYAGELSPMTRDMTHKRSTSGHTRITYAKCGGGEPSQGGGKFHLNVAGEFIIHADCQTGTLPCYDTSSSNCAPKQSDLAIDKCEDCAGNPTAPHDCCKGEAAGLPPLSGPNSTLFKGSCTVQYQDVTRCDATEIITACWDADTLIRNEMNGFGIHNIGRGWLDPNGLGPGIPQLSPVPGATDGIAWLREEDSRATVETNTPRNDVGLVTIITTPLNGSIRAGDGHNEYCHGDLFYIYDNRQSLCNHGFMNIEGICWPSSDKFIDAVILRWEGEISQQ